MSALGPLVDVAGRPRSSATMPGFHAGKAPLPQIVPQRVRHLSAGRLLQTQWRSGGGALRLGDRLDL